MFCLGHNQLRFSGVYLRGFNSALAKTPTRLNYENRWPVPSWISRWKGHSVHPKWSSTAVPMDPLLSQRFLPFRKPFAIFRAFDSYPAVPNIARFQWFAQLQPVFTNHRSEEMVLWKQYVNPAASSIEQHTTNNPKSDLSKHLQPFGSFIPAELQL